MHAVRNLDAAAALYGRLGFAVGARNQHPWGTHNRIVQFASTFVELLEIAEPDRISSHQGRFFSFGAFNRDFLKSREGLSMLIGKSSSAIEDAAAFAASDICNFDVFDFAREGRRPDGSSVRVAFSLAFAQDATSPNLGFAVCQQHCPENFWNPAFQRHANGATGIACVVLVAENPSDHHVFLKAFAGVSDLHSSSLGVKTRTEHGDIEIMSPIAFRDSFAIPLEASGEGMTLNAIRLGVADIGKAEVVLKDGGVLFQRHAGWLIVPPHEAFGATLIFEPAKVG